MVVAPLTRIAPARPARLRAKVLLLIRTVPTKASTPPPKRPASLSTNALPVITAVPPYTRTAPPPESEVLPLKRLFANGQADVGRQGRDRAAALFRSVVGEGRILDKEFGALRQNRAAILRRVACGKGQVPDREFTADDTKNREAIVAANRMSIALNRDCAFDQRQRLAQGDVLSQADNVMARSRRAAANCRIGIGGEDLIGQGAVLPAAARPVATSAGVAVADSKAPISQAPPERTRVSDLIHLQAEGRRRQHPPPGCHPAAGNSRELRSQQPVRDRRRAKASRTRPR